MFLLELGRELGKLTLSRLSSYCFVAASIGWFVCSLLYGKTTGVSTQYWKESYYHMQV